MRRVVVTGMGIVSCIGNVASTVSSALRDGISGICAMPDYATRGLRSQVAGVPRIDLDAAIDRKLKRFMGDAAAYAYVAMRCMRMALSHVTAPVDYLNTHGTATPRGDVVELEAVQEVFADAMPPLSSTKALTGHSLGAASVHEAIYSLLMMKDGFIAGSANIDSLDPRAESFPIVRESRVASPRTVMSNSFGFGGTNASLVFAKV